MLHVTAHIEDTYHIGIRGTAAIDTAASRHTRGLRCPLSGCRTLLGGLFCLSERCAQPYIECLCYPQQCLDCGQSFPLLHAADHRVAQACSRRDFVQRTPSAQALGLQQRNQFVDDELAALVFGHPNSLCHSDLDGGCDYRHK